MSEKPTLSRRTMLASAGGAAGAAALVGVGSKSAFAATAGDVQGGPGVIEAAYTPGAVTPGFSYLYLSGYAFRPIVETQTWSTGDGIFQFTNAATSGYAYVEHGLPPGAVIQEIEFYGTHTAGAATVSLWATGGSAGVGATQLASAPIPGAAGQFTVKLTVNQTVTNDRELVPFILTSVTDVRFFGVRIGYTGPTQLYLLPTPVRAHDSRASNGGPGPIPSGTTRTISLASAIPASAVGALMTLTLDNTAGSGFLSLFSAALASTTVSSVNWYQDGQVLANSVTSAVSGQSVKVFCGNGSTNFLIDVLGYYQ